jgi:hypothetical protein
MKRLFIFLCTLGAEIFGVGDVWLESRVIIKFSALEVY